MKALARTDDLVITRSDGTPLPAAAVVDDVSMHAVWWRKRWVLWYDEPWQFENARPWSHSVPIAVHVAAVLLGIGLTVVLGLLGAPWTAVAAVAAFAGGWVGAVTLSEYRFHRWVAGNDGRTLLEAFLPPRQHHPELLTSPAAQQALRDLTTARDVIEAYARVQAASLRGWRAGGTQGWVPLTALTAQADDSLLQLVAAAAAFRDANEEWGSEDDWDAAFHGGGVVEPTRPRLLTRFRRAGSSAAPRSDYVKTAEALTGALRRMKHLTVSPRVVFGQAPEPLGTATSPPRRARDGERSVLDEARPAVGHATAAHRVATGQAPELLGRVPGVAPVSGRRNYDAGWSVLDEFRSIFLVVMGLPAIILTGFIIFQFAWGVLELTGPEMTPGTHTACTLHAESNTHVATSCGVVTVPDELRDQLESDGPYDIAAEQSDGGVVATSVTPAAED